MVQRKVVNKLGIQADHVKYNKLLVSLKPSSLQHQETKNRGADMKKKNKKSRSINHSDIEGLSTPSLKRHVPQPGKPPPPTAAAAASSEKKTPVKTSENTPNYMKSTTSSDARKEQSQVSPRNLLPLFDSKSSSKKSSNSSEAASASSRKLPRTLARPSNLKLVRTLTKTTNFKPTRASANKCSPLALSETFNVQRATCSSTLKDSKFPAYVTLDSGGSEAEGTSAMKVCPYTYCSLNGHHHPPLPPLKSFLSARRRMLKTQRSIKLGCLSPRRSKSNKEATEEREKGKVNSEDNSSSVEALNHVIQQKSDDFFIQIYSKERETVADTSVTCISEEDDILLSAAPPNCHAHDSQVTESLLDNFPPEIGFHDNTDENGFMETSHYSPEEDQENQEADDVYPHFLADEEESTGSILNDDPESGNSDMDWEGVRYSTFYLDDEADNSSKSSQDYNLAGDSVEYDSFVIHDGSNGGVNSCSQGSQAGKIQAKSFDEESMRSDADFHQDFEIGEHVHGSGNESNDQLELITMHELKDDIKKRNYVESTVNILTNPLADPVMESCGNLEAKTKDDNDTAKVNPQVEDASIQTEVDAFSDYCENQFVQDDDKDEQTCHLDSQDMTTQTSTEECRQNNVNLYQSNAYIFVNCINSSGNTPPERKDSESETNGVKINAGATVKEKEQLGHFTANITVEIIITLQDSSEAAKMKSSEDVEENHIDPMAKDGKSNQTAADMDLPAETQDNISDQKFIAGSIENPSSSEENKDANFTSCVSTDSGDQPHSPMTKLSLADHVEQDSQNSEMGNASSLEEETGPASEGTSKSQSWDDLMEMEGNLDELRKTSKKLKWTSKRKKSTEEQEGPGEFNPRAPNFLPLEPEQEPEKVDLKHQMIDDRRNSEEWMLDYALQQTVTKLAPARKKKVALLVEAFEKVIPISNCDTQMRHASVGFAESPRPIQACS